MGEFSFNTSRPGTLGVEFASAPDAPNDAAI